MPSRFRTKPSMFFALFALAILMGSTPCLGSVSYSFTDLGSADPNGYINIDSAGHVETSLRLYPNYGKTAGNYVIKDVMTNLPGGEWGSNAYFGVTGQPLTELTPTLGFPLSNLQQIFVSGVNTSGTVVGIENSGFEGNHTYGVMFSYSQSGGMQPVATPYTPAPGISSGTISCAINDAGQIVGTTPGPGGQTVAFLTQGQQSWDLNTLIAPGSGFLLTSASDINDAGQIVGTAYDAQDGSLHFYVLTPAPTPAPEPASCLLLSTGLCAFGLHKMAKGKRLRLWRAVPLANE